MVEDMKKNLFRKMMALGLAVLMMAALVGCGGSTGTEESQGGEQPAGEFNPEDYYVAICMDNMNHPVHRIVQLGFLKAAEALGYTNAKVIGTEGGDLSEAFAAAEAFAAEG